MAKALKQKQFEKKINTYGKKMKTAASPALEKAGRELQKMTIEIARRTLAETKLKQRSGGLFKDIEKSAKQKAVVTKSSVFTVISSSKIYSNVQEFGATIVKKSKKLTVPLVSFSELAGRRARDIPGLFRITSRAGNILLVTKQGTGLKPWFVLKDQVTIPPRLGLLKMATKVMRDNKDLLRRLTISINNRLIKR